MELKLHPNRTWIKRNEYQIYEPEGIWDETLGQEAELLSSQEIFKKQWVIIVGERRIGKSCALRQEYEEHRRKCIHSDEQVIFIDLQGIRTWKEFKELVFQQPFFEKWMAGEGHLALFLDHVDESIAKDNEFEFDLNDYYCGAGPEVFYRIEELRNRLTLRMAIQPCFEITEWISFFQSFWREEEKEDFFGVYQLLPFREQEVVELLMYKGFEPGRMDLFLQAIKEPSVASFALKPEPLKMLIELDLQGNQPFPRSLPELFEQTCQRLYPNQSLETVSQIAANLVFTNRSTADQELDEKLLFQPDLLAYLAARWACHRLNTDQILQLITHPLGNGKIVPQLHTTAAWMASMNEEIFERILETDPNVLFCIPLDHFRKKQKEKLIRKFLDTAQPRDLVYTNVNAFIYPYFHYDGLADLLRPFLSPQREEFTRLLAMDIAKECKLAELAEDFLHLAFSEQKSEKVRWRAIHLYLSLTNPEEWKKCKPLIKDKDGLTLKMRKLILMKLWEYNQLSIPELIEEFAELYVDQEDAKELLVNPELFGEELYRNDENIHEILGKSNPFQLIRLFRLYLKEEQPTVALEWLIQQSFLYALNFLHIQEVKEVFLEWIALRLRQGKRLVNIRWEKELRRKWIGLLLDPEAVFDLSQSDLQKNDFQQILIREQDQLIYVEDLDWIRKQLEVSGPQQKWFWEQQLQRFEKKRDKFRQMIGIPPLDELFEKVKKEVEALEISDKKIVSSWASFTSWEVLIDPPPLYQEVTERLYQIAEVKEKLITAAKRFLSLYRLPEQEDIWSLNSNPYFVAGRKAFRILALLCPEQLRELPDSIWKAWRTLFVFPELGTDLTFLEQRAAVEKIPNQLEERYFQLVDSDDHFGVIDRFCQVYWSPSLEAGLFARLQKGKLSLDQYKYALYHLLKNQSKQTETWVCSLLNRLNPQEQIPRENMAVIAYCVLITHWNDENWNQVLNLMYKDVLLGKEIVSVFINSFIVDHYIYLKQNFQTLNEKTLERFYRWLDLHLEHLKEDEYVYGNASHWKEWILIDLRNRKTIPAYETIKRLVEENPSDPLAYQYWQWCETDYLCKTWVPVMPKLS